MPRVIQQVDINDVPLVSPEHRVPGLVLLHCHKVIRPRCPSASNTAAWWGPVDAVVAYLKGMCHASFSTIRKFVARRVRVTISRGQLAKVIHKVARRWQGPMSNCGLLPEEATLNVDETGHKDNGKPWWTWCFRARLYTLFKIDPSRGSPVLVEMLGRNSTGCWAATISRPIDKYMTECGVAVQFCLAHLIRDVKFLTTLPDVKGGVWRRDCARRCGSCFR